MAPMAPMAPLGPMGAMAPPLSAVASQVPINAGYSPQAPPSHGMGFDMPGAMPPAPRVGVDAPAVVAGPVAYPQGGAVVPTAVATPKRPVSTKAITIGIVALMLGGTAALFVWVTRSAMAPRTSGGTGPVVAVGAVDSGVAATPTAAVVADVPSAAPAPVDFRARADEALIAIDPAVRRCLAAERVPPAFTDLTVVFDNVSGRAADANVAFRGARGTPRALRGCALAAARSAHFETTPGASGTTRAARSYPGRVAPPPRQRRPQGTGGFDFPFGRHR